MIAILATALALPSVARAQTTFVWHVNYFDNSHISGAPDAKVRIVNSGAVAPLEALGGDVCAMIYVFAPDQQLEACCGCLVTPNGLLTLSVNNNLNTNVLSPLGPTASGVIEVVESLPNVPPGSPRPGSSPTCDPATPSIVAGIPGLFGFAALAVEGTHIQDTGSGTFGTTETADQAYLETFIDLTTAQPAALAAFCLSNVQIGGSGFGRCHCPGEKTAALDPPPLPAAPVVSPTPVSLPTVSAPASTAPSLSTLKLSASNSTAPNLR
jgi:hypothetical protein